MVAQALIASGADLDAFARQLARRFRRWLLGLPAGIGWATLRATLKLWCGFGPRRSGVFSAGNGPAMRSAILGAAIDDLSQLRTLVEVVTRITHSDPKAEYGALAVALAARHARTCAHGDGRQYLEELRSSLPQGAAAEFLPLMEATVRSVTAGESTAAFTEARGWRRGVSGYVYRTVPAAVHAWLRNPRDFRAGVGDVIRCGGDTDTTAAIVGGIIGSAVGKAGIPPELLASLFEWPRTVAWMETLAEELGRTLADGRAGLAPSLFAPALLVRNQLFLLIVLRMSSADACPPIEVRAEFCEDVRGPFG